MEMSTIQWFRTPGDCPGEPAPAPWSTATPDDAGLDGAALDALAKRIETGEIANVHAVLVVREGRLAFERFFAGEDALWGQPLGRVAFGPATLHDVRSVSKSVVGILVGVARGEGAIPDLDAPLASFFPEHAKGREADLAGRTLRHALTMTAGLAWDELTHPYWDPRNDENGMWSAIDPLAYALSRKPVAPGGARFAYNGGMPTLLAAAIERTTGKRLDRYAQEKLWCPLGIARADWVQHESGMPIAASGLRLLPRDMARFGQLMLDEGRFGERQLVPADYVRAALTPQVKTGWKQIPGYGYQWWVAEHPFAMGNGGQRIFVDRADRLVVVITAGNYDAIDQGASPARVIAGVLGSIRR
jgi:CubicO group peptidase (beta-lactamase class C family)